jgi:hypothetical protein
MVPVHEAAKNVKVLVSGSHQWVEQSSDAFAVPWRLVCVFEELLGECG